MRLNNIIINDNSTIRDAMERLSICGLGTIFVIDNSKKLVGIITDGDIRRQILIDNDLSINIKSLMNRNYFCLDIHTEVPEILARLSNSLKVIPLINKEGIIIDFATRDRIKTIPIASPYLQGNELKYLTDCIKSNWISSTGKYINKFENLFESYHNGMHALAVSSGTTALHLALLGLKVKKGDEVIVPNLTFAATINAIIYTGATPVLAEIDSDLNIDSNLIEGKLTNKTKAILIVHLYGKPCKMDKIMEITKKNNLFLIEDCAEAIGSKYKNNPVGTYGDAATFSFFGNKTLTTGEGGMVIFKDAKAAVFSRELRDHGMSKSRRYWHNNIGYNYRMTNLQAAIGVAQFEKLDKFIDRKSEIATLYNNVLSESNYFLLPKEEINTKHSYWLYTITVKEDSPFSRTDFMKFLERNAIESRIIFYPLSEMPPYKKYVKGEDFKISKKFSEQSLSLSTSFNLSDNELNHILRVITEFINLKRDN